MKTSELFEERISVRSLETSPRIDFSPAVGYWAVVQGRKAWKTNLLSPQEARQVIKTFQSVHHDAHNLRIVFVTK